MDIEFIVQDVYSLARPQWKLATSLEEASKAFQLAIAQDQKNAGVDSAADPDPEADDDAESVASSDEEGDGDAIVPEGDGEEDPNSEDEDGNELDVRALVAMEPWMHQLTDLDSQDKSSGDSESEEEEEIVVTRETGTIDPEEEADFEREYAKMMSESLESRKFDRKPLFDVPLPMRSSKTRETPREIAKPPEAENPVNNPANMMAFSLLTKKGNRQQVSPWRVFLGCTGIDICRLERSNFLRTPPLPLP